MERGASVAATGRGGVGWALLAVGALEVEAAWAGLVGLGAHG